MRRYAVGAAAIAAVALSSAQVFAFVKPADGSVLPDYDVRTDGSAVARAGSGAPASAVIADADNLGPIRGVAIQPAPAQLAAVERLRQSVAPSLHVEFREDNGLPRQLHAWGKPFTPASSADPVGIARAFLKANADLFKLTPAEVDGLVVARDYPTGTVLRTVWLAQAANGVLVDKGDIRFALGGDGRIFWVASGHVAPGLRASTTPSLSPEDAVRSAASGIGRSLGDGLRRTSATGAQPAVYAHPEYLDEVLVEPILFPMWGSDAILAWQVTLEPRAEMAQWWVVTVDGRSGKLLRRTNLYKYVTNQGLVFKGEYPNTLPNPPFDGGVPQTKQSFGYNWPSTTGWTIPAPYGQFNWTTGNNVDAKEDWLRDNETTIGQHADGGALQEWFFPFTDAYQQTTATTQAGRIADAQKDINSAITNLFYWNNMWHDYAYPLGFDEPSGNFQLDNYSRGGCGHDSIRADAQDGAVPASGNPNLNNANFGTPPEPIPSMCAGSSAHPRMQMYLWDLSGSTVLRDGDVDQSIIIHEHNHGVSTRLVGGPYVDCLGGTQSGAMGEGWSDWWGSSYFNRPITGAYAVNDPVNGIRNYPMNANPRTYADLCSLGGCEVHNDGEIHASLLWDLRMKVGKTVAEQLVMDAYKVSVCSPSFLDYRDAVDLADKNRYAGAHHCDIWGVYLARGMGFDAKGADSAYHVADFVFSHPSCSGEPFLRYNAYTTSDTAGGNGDGLYGVGETIDLNVELQNFDGVATATGVTATIATSTPGITLVQATRPYPNIPAGGKANPTLPFQFKIDPTFACGRPINWTVTMSWGPTARTRSDAFTDNKGSVAGIDLFSDDAEGMPLALAAPAAVSSAQNHTPGGSKSYYMISGCYAGDETSCTGTGPCNLTCGTVTLPPISLPTLQATYISFWARYNNEYQWDGDFVEVSADGGVTWTYVPTLNYTATIPANPGGCALANDIQAVSGPPANDTLMPWTKFEGDLAAWAGKSVILRIREHHDDCVYFEGGYIDDIKLSVRNCVSGSFVTAFISSKVNNDGVNGSCTDNDNNPDPGETVDAQIAVTNSGNAVANNMSGTLSSTNPNVTVVSGPQSYGTLNPGQAASATFRYTVANPGPACFEAADFTLALTANGGSFSQNVPFTETLRQDSGTGLWLDTFEGSKAPWTASLGPNGTASDFALHQLDCLTTGGNQWFWATQQGMVQTVCSTGEPDYSNNSDSLLTSPLIDLGAAGMKLTSATWNSFGINNTVDKGFVELAIDYKNSGTFTVIQHKDLGLGTADASGGFSVDIQNNPMGAPILPKDTAQFVRWQFRFRATGPDPCACGQAVGMIINDFQLNWQNCDVNACAPGLPKRAADVGGQRATLRHARRVSHAAVGVPGIDTRGSVEP